MNGRDDDANMNNNGASAQGIFSTPDLTVDTEKLAQTQSADKNERSRVASIFANTDAGQRSQELNNVMMSSAPETNYATEDIKLDKDTPHKRSKMPVVLIIIALLILVGGGVFLLANSFSNSQSGDTPQEVVATPSDVRRLFNEYANYLLSGTESAKDLEDEFLDEDYSIYNPYSVYAEAVIAGQVENVNAAEYLNKLAEKYQKFAESYVVVYDYDVNPAMKLYFGDFANVSKLTDEKILQMYLTNGAEGAQAMINSIYSTDLISSDEIKTYVENLKRIAEYQLAVAELAAKHNCVKNSAYEQSCLDDYAVELAELMNDEVRDMYADILRTELNLRGGAINVLTSVVEQIYGDNTKTGEKAS